MSLPLDAIDAATKAIEDHHRILILPHANVDPDGISSALACYSILRHIGKDVTVLCPDTPPESLSFLPGFEKFTTEVEESQNFIITVNLENGIEIDKLRYSVEDHKVNIIVVPKKGMIRPERVSFGEGEKRYDLILAVDTADLALFGSVYSEHVDLFSTVPILNVDHHISNTRYGHVHLIDPTAASATEVLYHWFTHVPAYAAGITPDVATLLLTGLITDTRSFQNPNTTPRSLEIAAELLERGARQQEIIQHIYKTKPLSTLKIWGRALNRIQIDRAGGIVWSSVNSEDLAEMGAESRETHGILDELISTIPDADVHILFTEMEGGGLKASMRSSAAIDCSRLAGEIYGGGGHARAAGFRVAKFDNFALQVTECIQKLKEGIQRQRAELGGGKTEMVSSEIVSRESKSVSSRADVHPATPMKSVDLVQEIGGEKKSGTMDVVGEITEQK